MTRIERRTTSSFIEALIDKAAKEMEVDMISLSDAHADFYPMREQPEYQRTTVEKAVRQIWNTNEAERFVAFAMTFPELLSAEEEKLWEMIAGTPYFWVHYQIAVKDPDGKKVKRWWPIREYKGLIVEHLREGWPLVNDIADGHIPTNLELFKKLNTVGKKVEQPPEYLKEISILLGASYGHQI
jgi:hypothetical protein